MSATLSNGWQVLYRWLIILCTLIYRYTHSGLLVQVLGHILVYLCSQFCLVSMLDGTEYLHHDNSIDMIWVLGRHESPHV